MNDLNTRLANHIAVLGSHQRERQGGKLLLEAMEEIIRLRKAYQDLHAQVGGYLSAEDWEHWQETNAEKPA